MKEVFFFSTDYEKNWKLNNFRSQKLQFYDKTDGQRISW